MSGVPRPCFVQDLSRKITTSSEEVGANAHRLGRPRILACSLKVAVQKAETQTHIRLCRAGVVRIVPMASSERKNRVWRGRGNYCAVEPIFIPPFSPWLRRVVPHAISIVNKNPSIRFSRTLAFEKDSVKTGIPRQSMGDKSPEQAGRGRKSPTSPKSAKSPKSPKSPEARAQDPASETVGILPAQHWVQSAQVCS